MNQLQNIWTKAQVGAPASPHGDLGLFLPDRKLITAAYLPDRSAPANSRLVPLCLADPLIISWFLECGTARHARIFSNVPGILRRNGGVRVFDASGRRAS